MPVIMSGDEHFAFFTDTVGGIKLGTETSRNEQRGGQKETAHLQIRAVCVKRKILTLQKG